MVEKDLELGEYEATWTLSGYDTLKARIEVKDTGVVCISVEAGACNRSTPPGVVVSAFTVTGYLKSAVTKGYLTVNTSPTGALVTVDGVSCGTTPVTAYELSTGSKTVTITKSGYNTVTRSVTITAGQPSDLGTITLTPTGAPVEEMTKSEFLTEIQTRGEIDLTKIPPSYVEDNKWWIVGHSLRFYREDCYIFIEQLDVRNPPSLESDVLFFVKSLSVGSISRDEGITAINALPFVGVAPPVEIGSWIDESGVTNLTPDHAIYVYYLSQGAIGAAETKYAGLSPKPSRLDPSIATVDNAMGIFYYSQGAMGAGNTKTGCNY